MSSPAGVRLILDCESIPDYPLKRSEHRSTSLSDLHEEENFDVLYKECASRCEKQKDKNFKHAAFEMLSAALRKKVPQWNFTVFQDQLKKVLSLYDGEELPAKASNDLLDQLFSLNHIVNPEPYFKDVDSFIKFWEFVGITIYPAHPTIWNLLTIHYCNYLCCSDTHECGIEPILKNLEIYISRSRDLVRSEEFRIVFLRVYVDFHHNVSNSGQLLARLQKMGGLDLNWISELLRTWEEADKSETDLNIFICNLLFKLFTEYSFNQIPQQHLECIFKNVVMFLKKEDTGINTEENRKLLKKLFYTSFTLYNMLEFKFQWKEKIDIGETLSFHEALLETIVDNAEIVAELFGNEKGQLMDRLKIEIIKAVIFEMDRLHRYENRTSSPRELKTSTSPRGNSNLILRHVAMTHVATNLTAIKKYLENLGIFLVSDLPPPYFQEVMEFALKYECLKPLMDRLKEAKP